MVRIFVIALVAVLLAGGAADAAQAADGTAQSASGKSSAQDKGKAAKSSKPKSERFNEETQRRHQELLLQDLLWGAGRR
jgi:hypothetical protein